MNPPVRAAGVGPLRPDPLPPIGVFWLFVLPFAALTVVFGVWPIVLSIQTSMTASATALKPNATWVGLAN
jgi:ABC-type sugar transport system permease subunit